MTQKQIDLIKFSSAGVITGIVNATPALGIKLSQNEREVYIANIINWIYVDQKGSLVKITFDFGQIMKRPPLYGLACSAIITSIFKKETKELLESLSDLEGLSFEFDYHM